MMTRFKRKTGKLKGKLKIVSAVFLAGVLLMLMTGCQDSETGEGEPKQEEQDQVQVVTSFSVIGDLIEEIGGDHVEVDYIVPLGEEPEEYEPSPSDFETVSDAEVFFINGYNIETWLEQVTENVTDVDIVPTAKEGPTIPLEGTDIPDPHLWLNPYHVKDYYVPKITDTLSELDPENEDYYQERAHEYAQELEELHEYISDQVSHVPEDHRIIITSENAFKYFGEEYEFKTDGIWEINSHEEGTPQQISRIIDLVQDSQVPAIFVESTIDPRYIENISEEAGVEIGGEVYTDGIGEEGSKADSYIKMMKRNAEVIGESLSE